MRSWEVCGGCGHQTSTAAALSQHQRTCTHVVARAASMTRHPSAAAVRSGPTAHHQENPMTRRQRLHALLIAPATALLALAAVTASPATAVAAGAPTQLTPIAPATANQSDYVAVYPPTEQRGRPAYAWSVTSYVAGVQVTPDSNGGVYAFCGQQYRIVETRLPSSRLPFPGTVTTTEPLQKATVSANRTQVVYSGRAQTGNGCDPNNPGDWTWRAPVTTAVSVVALSAAQPAGTPPPISCVTRDAAPNGGHAVCTQAADKPTGYRHNIAYNIQCSGSSAYVQYLESWTVDSTYRFSGKFHYCSPGHTRTHHFVTWT